MPTDHSVELSLPYWEAFFLETAMLIPHTRDSWECHILDVLNLYCMGGEL